MVLLDAGDALGRDAPAGKRSALPLEERAAFGFILEAMGSLGYDAMAVGERDLALGVDGLKKRAAAAGVTLLAANLVGKDGKKPFEEHEILTVGGARIGVFAVVSGEAFARAGLTVLPPLEQASLQARALRTAGVDLVVALLHLPQAASTELAKALDGVDFAIQAHDGRVGSAQLAGKTLLTPSGERGRQLGRVEFELAPGGGPLFDRAESRSAGQQLGYLEQTIARTRLGLESMPAGPGRKGQEQMLETLVQRREALLAKTKLEAPLSRSSVLSELVTLDRHVAEDPEMTRRAARADPHQPR